MQTGTPQFDVMNALKTLPVQDHAPADARRIRDRAVARLAARGRLRFRLPGRPPQVSRLLELMLGMALAFSLGTWTVARTIEVVFIAHGGFFWP